MTATTIRTFAEAEVALAKTLPGYESRPQQQALAGAIENLLAGEPTHNVGLFEAGCGTGKSLGAMIPAILSGKRTIIATATKALMNQYAEKDVPFLEANLGVPFTWALLKGRSNYYCIASALKADRSQDPWINEVDAFLQANPEHSGDVEDLASMIPEGRVFQVTTTAAECPGKRECPFAAQCYSEGAKEKASKADVVITNTAMLMTDLVVRKATQGFGSLLGTYDAVIVDEAHELEEWATSALSGGLNPKGLINVAKEAVTFASNQREDLAYEAQRVEEGVKAAWALVSGAGATSREPRRLQRSWFLTESDVWASLIESLKVLGDRVAEVTVANGDIKKGQARQTLLVTKAYNAANRVEKVLFDEDTETVRWAEVEDNARFGSTTHLKVAPIHVGAFLEETLWSQVPVALISATLSIGGSFNYIAGRLGIEEPTTLNVGTPFDYTTQARLFLPTAETASPKDRGRWQAYSTATTLDLVRKAGGGALLLFTSRSAMRDAYASLAGEFRNAGLTVLMQGQDGSNKEIAEAFKSDTHSVLFALKSFMTGFDAAGDTCRLVVIDKLAFPVPTEPVFAARADMVKKNGGSDFSDLSIPMMTLTMVQAFGRLIRTKQDKGVVAILDSRLTSTAWGKKIVGTLPHAPVVMTTQAAADFYQGA